MTKAKEVGIKTSAKGAFGMAFFFFVIFAYYAYAFYTGSWLMQEKVRNTSYRDGHFYDAGDILACFFGVVFGVFSLGAMTPNLKAISEGRVAGKLAFEIIDRVP